MSNKILFIEPLKLKKKYIHAVEKLIFACIVPNIFFFLNSQDLMASVKRPSEMISVFVENLMIRDGGLYTLLGSKPMTLFDVTCTVEETDEDIARSYEETKRLFDMQKQDPGHYQINGTLPDYEEYKKVCLSRRDTHRFLDRKKLWEVWQEEKGTFSNLTHALTSRKIRNGQMGLFINIPLTLHIIKKYQKEFVLCTGLEFDPTTILDSIEDENSVFWNKVCANHYLLGLLLGYGEKNAYLFDWARSKSFPLISVSILRFPELSRLGQTKVPVLKKAITIDDLPIPYFVSFEIDDPEVERYTREREKIIAFFKGQDYISFALARLGSFNCAEPPTK